MEGIRIVHLEMISSIEDFGIDPVGHFSSKKFQIEPSSIG
jgi:hypothetical protein